MKSTIGYLALLAAVGVVSYFGYTWIQDREPVDVRAAKAVLTLADNKTPLPKAVPPNSLLAISTEGSSAGRDESAIQLEIQPRSVAASTLRFERKAIIPVGPSGVVTIRLYVAKNDRMDATEAVVVVGSSPSPSPNPEPKPPKPADPDPLPAPTPAPTPPTPPAPGGPTDATVVATATAYFTAYPARYRADASKIAATAITYNELMEAQDTDRTKLGTDLGKAIDAVIYPTFDPVTTAFTDKSAAVAAFEKVANSIEAGYHAALTK